MRSHGNSNCAWMAANNCTGIEGTIEEVTINIDPSLYKVARVFSNGKPVPQILKHEVIVFETIDEDVFVLDAAGSQFGQRHAVLPLEVFMLEYRNPDIAAVEQHGASHSRIVRDLKDVLARPDQDARAIVVQAYMMQAFNKRMVAWQKEHKMSMSQIVSGTRRLYDEKEKECLDSACRAMSAAADGLGGGGFSALDILPKLEHTQPFEKVTELSISNKPEGSAIRQRLVAQQITKLQIEDPENWKRVYQPRLGKGGRMMIPIDCDSARDLEEEEKAYQAMKKEFYALNPLLRTA